MPRRLTTEQTLAALAAEDDGRPVRRIGPWTLIKLATVLLYLQGFADACQKADGGIYVDGLAGPGLCNVRNPIAGPPYVNGSPLVALQSAPGISKCILLELKPRLAQALKERTAQFGARAAVHEGDVNARLPGIVAREVPPYMPCVCLLDPQALELMWDTVSSIALLPGRNYRPELLILFPSYMSLTRRLTISDEMSEASRETVDLFFGTDAWRPIYEARLDGQIDAPNAIDQYFDLYCSRLRGLGYRWVLSRPISGALNLGERKRELYRLVFATDHPAGEEIMDYVFRRELSLDDFVVGRPRFEF